MKSLALAQVESDLRREIALRVGIDPQKATNARDFENTAERAAMSGAKTCSALA